MTDDTTPTDASTENDHEKTATGTKNAESTIADSTTAESTTAKAPTAETPTAEPASTDDADWPEPADDLQELADRLADRTVALDGTDPSADHASLDPLADRLADTRVVGLGEATHGTREFFQLKHRIIRFLVERLDYRLVALEANFSETLALDEYVVHGRGTPEDALESTRFWTWYTEEVRALLEWLRAFNDGRPPDDRVRFYGIDVQFTAGPAWALLDFLDDRDPAFLESRRETLEMLADDGLMDAVRTGDDGDGDGGDDGDGDEGDGGDDSDGDVDGTDDAGRDREPVGDDVLESRFATADALIDALSNWFDEQEAAHPDGADDELALHRRHCWALAEAVDFSRYQFQGEDESAFTLRDRAMADTVDWILDHEDRDRVAVWAHDTHLQRTRRESYWGTADSTGCHLAERYGDGYYAIGFDFADGEFQAIGPTEDGGRELRACSLGPPPADAATRLFATVEDPLWFVDLDETVADGGLADWLDADRPVRTVGAIYDPDDEHATCHSSYRLPSAFDGLVFVRETSRARPLDGD